MGRLVERRTGNPAIAKESAKAMGRSGLPEKPDNHTTSTGAIKCDLVFTMVLIGLRLASQVYCEAGKSSSYNYQMLYVTKSVFSSD